MQKFRYLGLALVASILWVGLSLAIPPSLGNQSRVEFHTTPSLNQITPNGEPVQISLQAKDATGHPLNDAEFNIQLLTPPKTPWLSSDFPIVEGTTLLELTTQAPTGIVTFAQVMPIRGNYRLNVALIPTQPGAWQPFQQSLELAVPENPVKYRNGGILIAILILAGLGGGWLIGGDQTLESGEVVPQRVQLLLSGVIVVAIATLLYVNISAEVASAHPHHDHSFDEELINAAPVEQSNNLELQITGDQLTQVGQLAQQRIHIQNLTTGNPEANMPVQVKTIDLDHGRETFSFTGLSDRQGDVTWGQQFFDGAPHRVIAEMNGNGSTLQVGQDIDVEAIAPPLSVRLISLAYLTGIFLVSTLVGLAIHRRFLRLSLGS
ncbi:hypothetical protein L3556_06900 [Candidatus Synechococcus calcipolaris G9]|uniref:Uncharacterized protein n=1 Tax=Candidatus Synechococcus calcipolaris G9 TaxID=1497997 RepID=A0ABT6EY46_9SYNE|nr:hypothetical protein [Candidatus Synechococcus calcipolaris]MDG2990662.1 hypothetical protein [Candidatus Synechococcus calcipolaris G9]